MSHLIVEKTPKDLTLTYNKTAYSLNCYLLSSGIICYCSNWLSKQLSYLWHHRLYRWNIVLKCEVHVGGSIVIKEISVSGNLKHPSLVDKCVMFKTKGTWLAKWALFCRNNLWNKIFINIYTNVHFSRENKSFADISASQDAYSSIKGHFINLYTF